jgi:hypothetical protein
VFTVARSSCDEQYDITAHKVLTGDGLSLAADISPDMSASIPTGSALAVSDVERVSRE